jgi:hypothetical protein
MSFHLLMVGLSVENKSFSKPREAQGSNMELPHHQPINELNP